MAIHITCRTWRRVIAVATRCAAGSVSDGDHLNANPQVKGQGGCHPVRKPERKRWRYTQREHAGGASMLVHTEAPTSN
jgi:hypothetical protein